MAVPAPDLAPSGRLQADTRHCAFAPFGLATSFMRTLRRIEVVWSACIAIALLGVLLRALIPTGYMASAERGPGFVICSGQTTDIATQKGEDPVHKGKADTASCPFAVLQLALQAPIAPAVGAPIIRFSIIPAAAQSYLAPGLGLAAPPPPPTGPPIFL